MSKWEKVSLGDLVKIKGGKRLPKGSFLQTLPNAHPYIRVRDMGQRYLPSEGLEYVPDDVFPAIKNYIVNKNDVIMSIVGSIGLISVVDAKFENASLTENCVKLSGLDHDDALYLYYYLSSEIGQYEIHKGTIGAVQAKLPLYNIAKLSISWPEKSQRKAIATILSDLDDKIALNREMNKTLEAMAQAIFKSWFVDFEPFKDGEFVESELGMIPKGWEVSTIGAETTSVGGATPSTTNPDFWEDGEFYWATPKDLSALQEKVLIGTDRKITNAGVKKISSGQLPIGTVLLSSRAPIGYLALTTIPVSINQGFIAMVCNKRLPNTYVLQWATSKLDDIKQRGSGTTFAEISKSTFRPMQVLVPDKESLEKYDEIVSSYYKQISINVQETQTLSALRDTLLPKLLSGEIEV